MDVAKATIDQGFVHDWWTKDVSGPLKVKINEAADSNYDYGVLVQVPWKTANDLHWIVVQGKTVIIDKKEYIPTKGTSINDYDADNRPDSWIYGKKGDVDEDIIYVPAEDAVKIHTIRRKEKGGC